MSTHHGAPVTPAELGLGTPVLARDRVRVGTVARVLADGTGGFEGLVLDARTGPGGFRLVTPDQVVALHEEAVLLSIDGQACADLPAPEGAAVVVGAPDPGAVKVPLPERARRAWYLLTGRP